MRDVNEPEIEMIRLHSSTKMTVIRKEGAQDANHIDIEQLDLSTDLETDTDITEYFLASNLAMEKMKLNMKIMRSTSPRWKSFYGIKL